MGNLPAPDALGDHVAKDDHRMRHVFRHSLQMSVLTQGQVGEERAVLIEEHTEPADHALELGAQRVVRLMDTLEHLGEGGEVRGKQFPGQLVLAPEVPVDGALGDAGGARDVSGRGLAQPLLHEEPKRLVENPLPRRGPGFVHRQGPIKGPFFNAESCQLARPMPNSPRLDGLSVCRISDLRRRPEGCLAVGVPFPFAHAGSQGGVNV